MKLLVLVLLLLLLPLLLLLVRRARRPLARLAEGDLRQAQQPQARRRGPGRTLPRRLERLLLRRERGGP